MIRRDNIASGDAGVVARRVGRIYLLLLLFCSVITCGGCATRNARAAKPYTDEPRLYPAMRYALRGEVARQWCEAIVPESKDSGWLFPDDLLQNLLMELGVGALGYTYSVVIEVPISLVTDTVLLPVDMRRKRAFNAGADVFADALFGNEWPVPAETLRAHYRRSNCDSLIQRLLKTQNIPHRTDKILSLIEAGAGLEHIAAFDELNAQMAARLMDQVAIEHPMRLGTLNELARNPLTPENVMIAIIQAGPYKTGAPSPMEGIIANPSVSPAVLDAVAETAESPAVLIRAAKHSVTLPDTLNRIAQRKIRSVNRGIAANPSVQLPTLQIIAACSTNEPEIDAALAENPNSSPEMLRRIVEDVSEPVIGKWILRSVSLHPAVTDETLRLVLQTCDALGQHPAAYNARDVINEVRRIASGRIKRECGSKTTFSP